MSTFARGLGKSSYSYVNEVLNVHDRPFDVICINHARCDYGWGLGFIISIEWMRAPDALPYEYKGHGKPESNRGAILVSYEFFIVVFVVGSTRVAKTAEEVSVWGW
jgi:hypothetical protein